MGFMDFEPKARRVLDRSRCPGLRMLDTLNENSYSESVAKMAAGDNGGFDQEEGEHGDSASSPEGPTTSLTTTPDHEFFPAIPAALQDCSAVKHLLKSDINKADIESSSLDFAQFLDFVTSTNTIRQLYDTLLVWLYNRNHYFLVVQQTKLSIVHTTVVVLLEVKSTRLQPPQWLAVVLETYNNGRPGRWIGEISIEWVDTSWRTAHSVLHVGAVSPVATLPWLDPVRLQALCAALRRFRASSGSNSIPIREHTGQKNRPPPSNPSRKGSDNGKKPRQQPGGGPAKPPGDSSEERDGTKPVRRQARNKIPNPHELPWACPLYKYDPIRHMGCLFHSLTESRHVKRHLLRHHKRPTHCPTCYECFSKKTECDEHIVNRVCGSCSEPEDWDRYISEDVRGQIDSVAGGDWFAMWDIIYPNVPRPPTPFLESADLRMDAMAAIGNDRSAPFRRELEISGLNEVQIQSAMEAYSRAFALRSPSTNSNSSDTAVNQLPAGGTSQQHGSNVGGHSQGAPPQPHPWSANPISHQRHDETSATIGSNSQSMFTAQIYGQQAECFPPQQGQNEVINFQDIPMNQEALEMQRRRQLYLNQQQRAQQQQRERQHEQQQQREQQSLQRQRQQLVQLQRQQHEAELHARAVNADGFPPTNLRFQQAINTVDQQRRQLHQRQRDNLWQRTFRLSAGHHQQNAPQHDHSRHGVSASGQALPHHLPQRQRQQTTQFPTQGTRMQRYPSTSASSTLNLSQRTHSNSNNHPTNFNSGASQQRQWPQWDGQATGSNQQQQFNDDFLSMLDIPAAPQASGFNSTTRQSAGAHGSAYPTAANAGSSSAMMPQQVMMRDDMLPFINPALLNNHAMSPAQPNGYATQPPPTPAPTDLPFITGQMHDFLDDVEDLISLHDVEESYMKIDPVEDEDDEEDSDNDDDDEEVSDDEE